MATGRHPAFEAAADAVHDGDVEALAALLDAHPELVHARAEHGATLVHHVGCNGVERQEDVPPVAILELLLARGADPDARCDLYGGSSALGLLVTSVFPQRAGLMGALVEAFARGGATLDHALNAAALHGRRAAVELLLARGANPQFVEPAFHSNAAGAARHAHHDDIAALLEAQ